MQWKPAALLFLALLIAAGLSACETGSPTPTLAPPTATPAPVPATAADLRLIRDAFADTQELTRFHYVLESATEGITATSTLEGDNLLPDQMYEHVNNDNGYRAERVYTGGKAYVKENDQWVEKPFKEAFAGTEDGPAEAIHLIQQFPSLAETYMYSSTNLINLDVLDTQTEEMFDGVATHVFNYTITMRSFDLTTTHNTPVVNAAWVGQTISSGSLSIDPKTKHLYKLKIQMRLALVNYIETVRALITGGLPRIARPLPTPGTSTVIINTLTLTHHNDPALTIPTP